MPETLQELCKRRMAELGGSTGPLSMRQVHLRGGGDDEWSYEAVRRIIGLGHTGVSDRVIDRLALALDLPVTVVERAAQVRPRLGRFQLPKSADRLDASQRTVVLSVIDALLSAMGRRDSETQPLPTDSNRSTTVDGTAPNE